MHFSHFEEEKTRTSERVTHVIKFIAADCRRYKKNKTNKQIMMKLYTF